MCTYHLLFGIALVAFVLLLSLWWHDIEFLTIKFEKKLYSFSRKKITGRAIGCTIQIKYRIHELKFQGFVRLLKYKLQV